jgi:hypothetical protein
MTVVDEKIGMESSAASRVSLTESASSRSYTGPRIESPCARRTKIRAGTDTQRHRQAHTPASTSRARCSARACSPGSPDPCRRQPAESHQPAMLQPVIGSGCTQRGSSAGARRVSGCPNTHTHARAHTPLSTPPNRQNTPRPTGTRTRTHAHTHEHTWMRWRSSPSVRFSKRYSDSGARRCGTCPTFSVAGTKVVTRRELSWMRTSGMGCSFSDLRLPIERALRRSESTGQT